MTVPATTVKPVTACGPAKADHGPYVRAVARSIEARDIRVAEVDLAGTGDRARAARLTLQPDQDAFAERVPDEALVFWDEEHGWALLTQVAPVENWLIKGLAVLPDPADIAAWVVVALTHPELTPSYEAGRLRTRGVPDPEFEARLARFPAPS